jgi:hypothetical protein
MERIWGQQSKDCDFKDCDEKSTDVIDCENVECCFSVYMCSHHYQYFRSYDSLGKRIDLKEIINMNQERYN